MNIPRIGIAGAGIAGLTIAGILSKKLGNSVKIDIIERGTRDRDQGYGLDFDEHGHEALKRAGIFDRYWEFSRPYSDTFSICDLQLNPLFIAFQPKILQKMFPKKIQPEPESNRTDLRNVWLDHIREHGDVNIWFERTGKSIRKVTNDHDGSNYVELLDDKEDVIGKYNLLIDASGIHSKLRKYRVHDKEGKHYEGQVLIHGVINDPDAHIPAEILNILKEGTFNAFGLGYVVTLQRFAASPDDHRTAFFYLLQRPNKHEHKDTLASEMGLRITYSGADNRGIITDEKKLKLVKSWLKRDMDDDNIHPSIKKVVDCLDRVTVLPEQQHGIDTTLRDDTSLPMICIGDSIFNIGLGGGGNLAMRDTIELSDILCNLKTFDKSSGKVDIHALRVAEEKMLARKKLFRKKRLSFNILRLRRHSGNRNLSMKEMYIRTGGTSKSIAFVIPILCKLSILFFRLEEWWWGKAGSSP